MASNNRVWWAVEKVAFKDNAAPDTNQNAPFNSMEFPSGALALHLNPDYVLSGVDEVGGRWEIARGVQSVGATTSFNLEEVFQLGQAAVYEDSERVPDIEFTVEKLVDGAKPVYFMVSDPAPGVNTDGTPKIGLNNRVGDFRCDIAMAIYPDTQERAEGTPRSAMIPSGMYLGSLSYTFEVDGPVTEAITFVGNDKLWANFNNTVSGEFVNDYPLPGSGRSIPVSGFSIPEAATGTPSAALRIVGSGVQRREDVDLRRSVLPSDIPGVSAPEFLTLNASSVGGSSSGIVLRTSGNLDNMIERLQTITLSVDLNRTDANELGSKRPYVKHIAFPIETTATIEVITAQGDMIEGIGGVDKGPDNTVANNTIIVRTCDGLQVDLGDQMRLQSIDMAGGEAGGDNLTVTYNYRGFNIFNVTHDRYYPHHRVYVSSSANSRFNVGAAASL